MSVKETQERIRTRIWKAIAQSEVDLSALSKEELDALVEVAAEAAMIEMDHELQKAFDSSKTSRTSAQDDLSKEEELWRGRPFLSLTTEYIITNQRVRISSGLLGKEREDIELIYVQDLDQIQSFSDRLLKLGDLVIMSHDPSDPKVVLENIRDPQNVHDILRNAVRNARRSAGLIYREEM